MATPTAPLTGFFFSHVPPMTAFKDFLVQINATLPHAHALTVLVGGKQVPFHSLLVTEIGDMVAICDGRLAEGGREFRVLSKSNIDLEIGSKYFYELEPPEKKAADARAAELRGDAPDDYERNEWPNPRETRKDLF